MESSIRSNSYDSLGSCLSNLKVTSDQVSQLIRKANKSQKLDTNAIEEGIEVDKAADSLSKLAYSQFLQLKADHDTKKINPARYKASLSTLKTFLDDNPSITNKELHRDEIMKEANLYC